MKQSKSPKALVEPAIDFDDEPLNGESVNTKQGGIARPSLKNPMKQKFTPGTLNNRSFTAKSRKSVNESIREIDHDQDSEAEVAVQQV